MKSGIVRDIDQITALWHQGLNAELSIIAAVRTNSCPLPRYLGLLRALTALFGVIERRLDRPEFETAAHAVAGGMRKLPWLHRDLLAFRYHFIADHPVVVGKVSHFANTMRQRISENPRTLLSYLYALEGATQFVSHLFTAMSPDSPLSAGSAYCAVWGANGPTVWRQTGQSLDSLAILPTDHADLIAVAVESYQFVRALLATLESAANGDERRCVFSLNPHAPDHPVPQSPVLWRAGAVATDRFLATHPYYAERMGSDIALRLDAEHSYLTTAASRSVSAIAPEAKLLVERDARHGVPPAFAVRRFELLAEELTVALPERAADWAGLRHVAGWLAVPAVDRDLYTISAATGFGATDGESQALRPIVAALRAEKDGFGAVAEAVVAWYTDPHRYAAPWIRSVHTAVSAARRAIGHELQPESVVDPTPSLTPADGSTVMVVDDNDTYRAVICRWLTRAGYAVREAADGVEALRVVDRYRPVVVIADIFMPQKDGLELVRQLRDRPYLKGIIVMTGHGLAHGVNELQAAEEFGVDVMFRKPIEKTELLAALSRLVARNLEPESDAPHRADEPRSGGVVFDQLP